MTVFLPILVCLCGGVGASCRYLLDVTIKTYWQRAFPLSRSPSISSPDS